MPKFKKGDLVHWTRPDLVARRKHRGIVLEESLCGNSYRVLWLTGGGGLGEHYRDDLVKIEVESEQTE